MTSPNKAPRKRPGRPNGLTTDVRERIITALTAGNYQDVAAAYGGVSPAAFYKWCDRGRIERERREQGHAARADETIYVEFVEAVESARSQAEVRAVALINQAAQGGTWQAAAWFLERSHPHRWGRFQRTEVTGKGGGPVEVDVASLERKIAEVLGEDLMDDV